MVWGSQFGPRERQK